MTYLLDTCIVSLFFRKESFVVKKFKQLAPEDMKISTITCMEVEYGMQLNPAFQSRFRPFWLSFQDQVEALAFSQTDATHAAQIRSVLKPQGKQIGPYDVLLAGIARNRGLVLVTDNMSEFKRVDGLMVENWVVRD